MTHKIMKLSGVFLTIIGLSVALYPTLIVHANIGSCSVAVSPSSVSPGSNVRTTLTVTNSSSTAIQYLRFHVPAGNFFYTDSSTGAWGTGNPGDGSGVVLSDSSLDPGQSQDFQVFANTSVSNEAPAGWAVDASDDPNGANPTSCGGSLNSTVAGHLPSGAVAGISNIAVSSITNTSVLVSWDSDVDTTSVVYYGKTANYSVWTDHDKTPTSSHTMNLTGLSPGTNYHFQVAGQDDSLNPSYSADGTFVTTGSPAATASSLPDQTPINTPIPIKAIPTENIPPTIALTTTFANAYKITPIIKGSATDNSALAGIEYSTDGGQNWLPVDNQPGLGGKRVDFSFTPINLDDGNYVIMARAIDTSGNVAKTAPATLVIDRLPPLVGGNIVSVGPQIMQPSSDGTLEALAGVDQMITLSAVGGATRITLEARDVTVKNGKTAYTQTFSLTRSEDTGLWSGVAGFSRPGTYSLVANAVDGAGNTTTRELNVVHVASPGRTLDSSTHKAVTASVTAYYLEPETHTWVVWDAAAFGQSNPQRSNTKGAFSMFLPPGAYYLQAKAVGFHVFVSSIFTVKQATPFTTSLQLRPMRGPHLASHYVSWPSLAVQHVTPAISQLKRAQSELATQTSLINKPAPDFSLKDTAGSVIRPADLLGRPTVISINSIWSPTTAEQLSALSRLQANHEINVVPVALQDNLSRVQTYTAIADVNLRWLADPDSSLSVSYKVHSLPTQYFLDRKGVVRHVVVGILSRQQMLDLLTEL